jgi:hypothetical protein
MNIENGTFQLAPKFPQEICCILSEHYSLLGFDKANVAIYLAIYFLNHKFSLMEAFGRQYEVLPCQFCETGEIRCLYFPSAVSFKRNVTASLPGLGSL